MQRVGHFLSRLYRILFSAESAAAKSRKWMAWLAAAFAFAYDPIAHRFNWPAPQPVWGWIVSPWLEWAGDMSPLVIVTTAVIIIVASLAIGASWGPSRGPWLVIAHDLELDRVESVYRLRIKNDGVGGLEPQVSVTAILDENMISLVEPSRLPFALSWSEDEQDRTAQLVLKADEEQTIGVFLADVQCLEFRGATHLPEIDTVHHRTVVLCLVVRAASRQKEERWFEILRDNEVPHAPYRVRGIASPRRRKRSHPVQKHP